MMVRDWIRSAQAQGWLVSGVKGRVITIKCDCIGCHGTKDYFLESLDAPPPPCALDHVEKPKVERVSRPAFTKYENFIAEFRRKRVTLGLDQLDLGEAMGVPDGYIGKLESFARVASPVTLLLWAQTLGLEIITRPAALPPATIKAIQDRAASPYAHNQVRQKHG
ncbi:MAG: helix-turn-helix domain-containing protein [Pikeienuella sp.]